MKYLFEASVVVEAATEEDAVSLISGRMSTIARHLGNREPLAASKPFFTLTANADGDPVDMWADPIIEARKAAAEEAAAEVSKPATPSA